MSEQQYASRTVMQILEFVGKTITKFLRPRGKTEINVTATNYNDHIHIIDLLLTVRLLGN